MKTVKPTAWLGCLAFLVISSSAAEQIAVVRDGRINVRGQPSLVGEVITQLQKGEQVVVLEELTAPSSKTNAPSRWYRIQMPAHTPVWVYAPFVDPASKTVKVSRLNLRAGPGENYSVVGRLERGAPISEIRRVEDWMEVETPPGAYAFVAADLFTKTDARVGLTQTTSPRPTPSTSGRPSFPSGAQPGPSSSSQGGAATLLPPPGSQPGLAAVPAGTGQPQLAVTQKPAAPSASATATPEPPRNEWVPVSNSSAPAPTSASAPAGRLLPPIPDKNERPSTAAPASPTGSAPAVSTPAVTGAMATGPKPGGEEDPNRRVVRREGLVRSTVSIQAPTYYELLNPENRKTINYLHAENLGINLKDYRGRRVVVTGEEAIDPRWPKTPLIEVETLQLIP